MSAVVKAYMTARQSGDLEGALSHVTEDIAFVDASGNKVEGKAAFGKHLHDNPPPESKWEEPVGSDNVFTTEGKVKRLMMWWSVRATFTLTGDKISSISLTKL
eukprot:TRINITY_DN233_c0_g1_i3.p2 TRINITY_DN233_c0_g1~~TRINITY_DN233_c0_g1_i3.p2  ORF type:complete len:103 (+),score=23.40 TRINITY_DN233_c0_g1_i3:63-371(+)